MNRIVFFALLLVSRLLLAQSAEDFKRFSFEGHFVVQNDLPAPLTLTLFDFQLQPGDESDAKALGEQLSKIGVTLVSEKIYGELKDGAANIAAFVQSPKGEMMVFVFQSGKVYMYNVTSFDPEKKVITSRDPSGNYGVYTFKVQ